MRDRTERCKSIEDVFVCESKAGWNEFMSGTRQRQLHTAGTGEVFTVASLVSV